MTELHRIRTVLLCCALLAVLVPHGVDGQFRRGRAQQDSIGWAPIVIGAHLGYDQNSRGELLGVQARVPVLRSGMVELLGGWDMTFLDGAKDYHYSADAVWVTGGRDGGFFLGGGLGIRDTVVGATTVVGRETLVGYEVVAGARTGAGNPYVIMLQFKWIFLPDTSFRPVPFSLGVGFPLWGR